MLTIITTSVSYGDLLRLSLPEAVKYGRVIVATHPLDKESIAIAAQCGAECVQTCVFFNDNAAFNKGAGINAALDHAGDIDWLLLMDADIVLMPPPPGAVPIEKLDKQLMYSVQRRSIKTPDVWQHCVHHHGWYHVPCDPLPPRRRTKTGNQMKVWGRPTGNPIGLAGYYQLWHYKTYPHRMHEHRTAAKYDVELALKWQDDDRKMLPWHDYAVLHLGKERVNWKGRKTARWNVYQLPPTELEQAAQKYYEQVTDSRDRPQ